MLHYVITANTDTEWRISTAYDLVLPWRHCHKSQYQTGHEAQYECRPQTWQLEKDQDVTHAEGLQYEALLENNLARYVV